MTSFRHWGIVFLILLFCQTAFAQKAPQREWAIFQKGRADYENGDYQKAKENFALVLKRLTNSPLLTANQLMLAKTHYKLNEYSQALELCKNFIIRFPESSYLDDIYYLMANTYYRLQRSQTAVQTWLFLAAKFPDSPLRDRALQLAEKSILFQLDERAVVNLKKKLKDDFSRRVVMYSLAQRYYEAGKAALALSELEESMALPAPADDIADKSRRLYDFLKNKKSDAIRIAALLPLSGPNSDVGRALLDGAQLALDEFRRLYNVNVELVPFDYETNLIKAIWKLQEIARDKSIAAVFGPVENDISAACAAISEYEQITLITPTASHKDLRRLSGRFIQLALPVDVLAQQLARFAIDSVRVRRMASLSPIDDYFLDLTHTFLNRLKDNETSVVAEEWYYPGEQDITKHFKALKRVGLRYAFRDSIYALDSLHYLSDEAIDSLFVEYQKEQRLRLAETRTKIDSADIPVHSIDGLFLPVYKDDLGLMAAQFAYSNIRAHIFGNSDWYDIDKLNKNKSYINGIIFVSDGYLNEEGQDYRQFVNKFRNAYKRTPDRFDIIGYDSFGFVLSALSHQRDRVNRDNFSEIVQSAGNYDGIYRKFNVHEKRYNNSARLLKYMYGQIVPLN